MIVNYALWVSLYKFQSKAKLADIKTYIIVAWFIDQTARNCSLSLLPLASGLIRFTFKYNRTHSGESQRERTTNACTVHIQVLIKIESKSSLSLSQHYKRHYPTTYLYFQCTLLLKHTVLPFLSECRSSVVRRANVLICKAPTHLTVLNINFSFFGRRGQFLVRNKFRRNCFLRKGSIVKSNQPFPVASRFFHRVYKIIDSLLKKTKQNEMNS